MIGGLWTLAAAEAGKGIEAAIVAGPEHWFVKNVMMLALFFVCVAMAISAYRLVKGPQLPDRVVSLDLLANFIVGAIGVYAILSGRAEIVSVAIVMALILFVGTAAFALYLEKGERRQ
ncbi:MAG: monovalent cation/H+ antiporter complex subunit F [Planctomycetota bacterium]